MIFPPGKSMIGLPLWLDCLTLQEEHIRIEIFKHDRQINLFTQHILGGCDKSRQQSKRLGCLAQLLVEFSVISIVI